MPNNTVPADMLRPRHLEFWGVQIPHYWSVDDSGAYPSSYIREWLPTTKGGRSTISIKASVLGKGATDGELISRQSADFPVIAVRLVSDRTIALTREQRRIEWDGDGAILDSRQFAQAPAWLLPDGSVPEARGSGRFSRASERTAAAGSAFAYVEDKTWVLWQNGESTTGTVPNLASCTPVISATSVLYGTNNSQLVCLRRSNGEEIWTMSTEASVSGLLPAPDKTIFVMLANGKLLHLERGKE